jgi:2-C-methyl-D-erythritol 4-phosphate cytidylyltransferase
MFYALLPAAGSSSRMAGDNKLLAKINNKSVISYTVEKFVSLDIFQAIVIVCPHASISNYQDNLISDLGESFTDQLNSNRIIFVAGAETRQRSVYCGLLALQALKINLSHSFIAIHDAARCLISKDKIQELCNLVKTKKAVTAAIPVVDTIKRTNSNLQIIETITRESLWRIQTPQIFQADILFQAHESGIKENFQVTDDASLVEKIHPVYIAQGEEGNIKITYPEDLEFCRKVEEV